MPADTDRRRRDAARRRPTRRGRRAALRRRRATSPASPKPDPILVVDDVTPALRRPHRRRRRPRRDPARRHHRADRPERRRQDDVLQPAHRLRPARRRATGRSTAQRSTASPALQGGPAGHGAHLPAHQGAVPADGDREHAARRHRPAGENVCHGAVPRRLWRGQERRDHRARPTSCSARFKLDAEARRLRRHRCPAASASCSRWPGR